MVKDQSETFTLLIVDDIPANIQVLGNILQEEGYAVSFATSGRQALEMALEESYDLILLDVMMPEMDGFEVCARLHEIPGRGAVPVIFLTAKTAGEDIVRGFETGAVDYVTKPFNPPELLARVHTHLELKCARDKIQRAYGELSEKNRELSLLNEELRKALSEIKTLQGLLPICSHCKRIRKKDAPYDVQDSWVRLESYLGEHTEAQFTHSLCPQCARQLYPDLKLEGRRGSDPLRQDQK
jgi:phosphoserine phosphatase RsbU/P